MRGSDAFSTHGSTLMLARLALFLMAGALAALSPRSALAQIATYDIGVKAGINASDFQSDRVGGDERRRAYVGGGFVEADFVGPLAVQAELLFSQKGDETELGTGTFEVKLNYIEVPVMAKLQGPLLGNAEANFYAGPAVALKVSESTEGLAPNTRLTGTVAKSVDVSAALGVEFGVGVGAGRLIIDLRFTPGFTQIRDNAVLEANNATFEIPDPEASNSTLSVMVGLAL